MYKVMIVEDEPIERDAIKLIIENNCSDIEVVAVAANGYEAIMFFEKYKPDIVIMDINMPGINGLQTIDRLKKLDNSARYIIITSYDKFEYAKEAISLGVDEFILKPSKSAQIVNTINSIKEKLESESQVRERETNLRHVVENIKPVVEIQCIRTLVSGDSTIKLKEMLEFMDIKPESGFCFVLYVDKDHYFCLNRIKMMVEKLGITCIGEIINEHIVFFILSERQIDGDMVQEIADLITSSLKEHSKIGFNIGFSDIAKYLEGMDQCYNQAIEALNCARITDKAYMIYHQIETTPRLDVDAVQWSKTFADAIVFLKLNQLEEDLDSFISEILLSYSASIWKLKEYAYRVLILVEKEVSEQVGFFCSDRDYMYYIKDLDPIYDIKELRYYLLSSFQRISMTIQEGKGGGGDNISGLAKKYINENFHSDIRLNDIADKLRITPFYLSRVFKETTGDNITDYISMQRIRRAKELLSKGDTSIKEITFEVGFNSQNYFTKVFKKYVGMTPTEYRNQYGS